MQTLHIQVDEPAARLDQFLADAMPHLSRSKIQKLIRQGHIHLQHQPARASARVVPGDVITVHLPQAEPEPLQAEAVTPLEILYEDDHLIAVNKPAGLVVHPGAGHVHGTLVQALLSRYPDLASMSDADDDATHRPGIVHRLDRDTSGVILIARTPIALRRLRHQFKVRTVEKKYLALVVGRPEAPAGLIDVPLGRDPRNRQRFAPRSDGKPARTRYTTRQALGPYTLLDVDMETGRTHQIRVHLAWLGCPIAGDTVYGPKKKHLGLTRHFLHAWKLQLKHPESGQLLPLEAPPDPYLMTVLAKLGGSL